jgi:hypothetical protein
MFEAERQFRRVIGYDGLAKLALAVEREITSRPPPPHTHQRTPLRSSPSERCTRGPPSKFHAGRDILRDGSH